MRLLKVWGGGAHSGDRTGHAPAGLVGRDGQPAALFEVLMGDHTELWLGEIVPG